MPSASLASSSCLYASASACSLACDCNDVTELLNVSASTCPASPASIPRSARKAFPSSDILARSAVSVVALYISLSFSNSSWSFKSKSNTDAMFYLLSCILLLVYMLS